MSDDEDEDRIITGCTQSDTYAPARRTFQQDYDEGRATQTEIARHVFQPSSSLYFPDGNEVSPVPGCLSLSLSHVIFIRSRTRTYVKTTDI